MPFVQISTENPLGNRPLNLMARQQGMGWLGTAAPTPGDYDNNQAVLGALVAMGAITQDDANQIWAGSASLDDTAVNMTMINQALQIIGQSGAQIPQPLPPSTSTPLPPTPAPAAAPAGSTAQLPGGSTLLYTATVVGGYGNLTLSPSSAMSQFSSALAQHGLSVVASANDQTVLNKLFGTGAPINFQFQIVDNVGHAFVNDAKSVCDAVLRQIVGNNVTTSQLVVTSTTAVPTGAAPTASVTAFLENNAALLAGLALAIVTLPPLIKKL